MGEQTLRVLGIVDGTSVDGPGLRTSIYLAGCCHHCPGCHNPESWDLTGGDEMTVSELLDHVLEQDFDVTISGGDPFVQEAALKPLMSGIKRLGKNIWCYTGFLYEQILNDELKSPLLDYIDVLVDGPFHIRERDISLLFRGSSNQRLVDVKKSLQKGAVVEWTMD